MKRFFALCLFCAACSTTACATVPPVPTPAPVDYVALCAHLVDIGCPEGAKTNCASTFARIEGAHMAELSPQCLLDASEKSQARNCGTIACQ
jgi:hypothetical protein